MLGHISKSQLLNLLRLYLLCDKSGKVKIYNFNEDKFIFVVRASEFDVNGWKNIDGFSFREKLYILGFSTDVVWRKAGIKDILCLMLKCKFLFPYQFLVTVKNQNVDKYIGGGSQAQAVYLYREVTH